MSSVEDFCLLEKEDALTSQGAMLSGTESFDGFDVLVSAAAPEAAPELKPQGPITADTDMKAEDGDVHESKAPGKGPGGKGANNGGRQGPGAFMMAWQNEPDTPEGITVRINELQRRLANPNVRPERIGFLENRVERLQAKLGVVNQRVVLQARLDEFQRRLGNPDVRPERVDILKTKISNLEKKIAELGKRGQVLPEPKTVRGLDARIKVLEERLSHPDLRPQRVAMMTKNLNNLQAKLAKLSRDTDDMTAGSDSDGSAQHVEPGTENPAAEEFAKAPQAQKVGKASQGAGKPGCKGQRWIAWAAANGVDATAVEAAGAAPAVGQKRPSALNMRGLRKKAAAAVAAAACSDDEVVPQGPHAKRAMRLQILANMSENITSRMVEIEAKLENPNLKPQRVEILRRKLDNMGAKVQAFNERAEQIKQNVAKAPQHGPQARARKQAAARQAELEATAAAAAEHLKAMSIEKQPCEEVPRSCGLGLAATDDSSDEEQREILPPAVPRERTVVAIQAARQAAAELVAVNEVKRAMRQAIRAAQLARQMHGQTIPSGSKPATLVIAPKERSLKLGKQKALVQAPAAAPVNAAPNLGTEKPAMQQVDMVGHPAAVSHAAGSGAGRVTMLDTYLSTGRPAAVGIPAGQRSTVQTVNKGEAVVEAMEPAVEDIAMGCPVRISAHKMRHMRALQAKVEELKCRLSNPDVKPKQVENLNKKIAHLEGVLVDLDDNQQMGAGQAADKSPMLVSMGERELVLDARLAEIKHRLSNPNLKPRQVQNLNNQVANLEGKLAGLRNGTQLDAGNGRSKPSLAERQMLLNARLEDFKRRLCNPNLNPKRVEVLQKKVASVERNLAEVNSQMMRGTSGKGGPAGMRAAGRGPGPRVARVAGKRAAGAGAVGAAQGGNATGEVDAAAGPAEVPF